jgi:hypothetical protein
MYCTVYPSAVLSEKLIFVASIDKVHVATRHLEESHCARDTSSGKKGTIWRGQLVYHALYVIRIRLDSRTLPHQINRFAMIGDINSIVLYNVRWSKRLSHSAKSMCVLSARYDPK